MSEIDIQDLTKSYDLPPLRRTKEQATPARHVVVDRVNLHVATGAVMGIIGPTGAGKTTLLRMLATLLKPTDGDAIIGNASIRSAPTQVRQNVGYLPSEFGLYSGMTCAEYIGFFAGCYNIPSKEHAALVNDLLQLVDLGHRHNEPLERLSRGMKQRLGLARTLVHDPQVLLLDEPTAGLDPRARVELRELIGELSDMGKTVLMTSSLASEVDGMCTHLALMSQSRVQMAGPVDRIEAQLHPHRRINIRFLGEPALAQNIVQSARGVLRIEIPEAPPVTEEDGILPPLNILKEMHVTFDGDYNTASDLLRSLMHTGVQVVSFGEEAIEYVAPVSPSTTDVTADVPEEATP